MAPPGKPFDLKQVAKLFNDTLSAIRDGGPEALEPDAKEWLKAARHQLMRDVEKRCGKRLSFFLLF